MILESKRGLKRRREELGVVYLCEWYGASGPLSTWYLGVLVISKLGSVMPIAGHQRKALPTQLLGSLSGARQVPYRYSAWNTDTQLDFHLSSLKHLRNGGRALNTITCTFIIRAHT